MGQLAHPGENPRGAMAISSISQERGHQQRNSMGQLAHQEANPREHQEANPREHQEANLRVLPDIDWKQSTDTIKIYKFVYNYFRNIIHHVDIKRELIREDCNTAQKIYKTFEVFINTQYAMFDKIIAKIDHKTQVNRTPPDRLTDILKQYKRMRNNYYDYNKLYIYGVKYLEYMKSILQFYKNKQTIDAIRFVLLIFTINILNYLIEIYNYHWVILDFIEDVQGHNVQKRINISNELNGEIKIYRNEAQNSIEYKNIFTSINSATKVIYKCINTNTCKDEQYKEYIQKINYALDQINNISQQPHQPQHPHQPHPHQPHQPQHPHQPQQPQQPHQPHQSHQPQQPQQPQHPNHSIDLFKPPPAVYSKKDPQNKLCLLNYDNNSCAFDTMIISLFVNSDIMYNIFFNNSTTEKLHKNIKKINTTMQTIVNTILNKNNEECKPHTCQSMRTIFQEQLLAITPEDLSSLKQNYINENAEFRDYNYEFNALCKTFNMFTNNTTIDYYELLEHTFTLFKLPFTNGMTANSFHYKITRPEPLDYKFIIGNIGDNTNNNTNKDTQYNFFNTLKSNISNEEYVYDIISIVVHHGSGTSGHFTAAILYNKAWYYYDGLPYSTDALKKPKFVHIADTFEHLKILCSKPYIHRENSNSTPNIDDFCNKIKLSSILATYTLRKAAVPEAPAPTPAPAPAPAVHVDTSASSLDEVFNAQPAASASAASNLATPNLATSNLANPTASNLAATAQTFNSILRESYAIIALTEDNTTRQDNLDIIHRKLKNKFNAFSKDKTSWLLSELNKFNACLADIVHGQEQFNYINQLTKFIVQKIGKIQGSYFNSNFDTFYQQISKETTFIDELIPLQNKALEALSIQNFQISRNVLEKAQKKNKFTKENAQNCPIPDRMRWLSSIEPTDVHLVFVYKEKAVEEETQHFTVFPNEYRLGESIAQRVAAWRAIRYINNVKVWFDGFFCTQNQIKNKPDYAFDIRELAEWKAFFNNEFINNYYNNSPVYYRVDFMKAFITYVYTTINPEQMKQHLIVDISVIPEELSPQINSIKFPILGNKLQINPGLNMFRVENQYILVCQNSYLNIAIYLTILCASVLSNYYIDPALVYHSYAPMFTYYCALCGLLTLINKDKKNILNLSIEEQVKLFKHKDNTSKNSTKRLTIINKHEIVPNSAAYKDADLPAIYVTVRKPFLKYENESVTYIHNRIPRPKTQKLSHLRLKPIRK